MDSVFDREGNEYHIRPVYQVDGTEILAVYRQCEDFLALGPVSIASQEMVSADLEHSRENGGLFHGIYRVLSDGSEMMVGIVDYIPSGVEGSPQMADLTLLMIAATYRSQGLGQAVADWVEQQIRRDPAVRCIRSGVQFNNPKAIRFWQRMGYQITGEAREMGDGTTAYPLQKSLL